MSGALTIAVDTGGTFTDLVACDAGGSLVEATKVPTTRDDPSAGIAQALTAVAEPGRAATFLHGTTTGTNALLERRGARTAFLVTRGFRDILVLARQNRPNLYDWFQAKPDPYVPRELCVEIDERLSPQERARRPLDEADARLVVRRLAAAGVESVAVCLLHAYEDPRHERRVAEIVREELPGVHVSLSSDVLPDIMEYERAATTVANAYLAPVIERYLGRLATRLRHDGIRAPLYVMQSNGGLGAAAGTASRAVNTVLSGPAAGVIGGLACTYGSATSNFLTVDMGGTSFDIAYSERREPAVSRETVIDGQPLAVPALDIHTLGAGGGSIAWIDAGGVLRVGPASAGSEPGPACYGGGGELPTVTDANLVLGRLSESLLGGRLTLDCDAAWHAIEAHVARPLRLDVVDAAQGIVDVVDAAMAKGMHLMSVARGRDPRGLGIVAFGGAGPAHACDLADAIGCDEVIVPRLPGNTSAMGLALAKVRRERSQTVLAPIAEIADSELRDLLGTLARRVLEDLQGDGVAAGDVTLAATARMSYEGQRYQLDIPLAGPPLETSLQPAGELFRQRHLAAYGYTRVEPLVLFGVVVAGTAAITTASSAGPTVVLAREPRPAVSAASRQVWFGDAFREASVYDRGSLPAGVLVEGPSVVEQSDSTTVVPPGWSGLSDSDGNLHLRRSR
jgi:N-methylhydantoinase A